MDENRVVDLFLIGILVLGTAFLIGFHFLSSHHPLVKPAFLTSHGENVAFSNQKTRGSRLSFQVTPSRGGHEVQSGNLKGGMAHPSGEVEETITVQKASESKDDSPLAKRSLSSRVAPLPVTGDTHGFLGNESAKENPKPARSLSPEPFEKAFQETARANGNFYLAQEIEDGVITGRRGAADDKADFYKIRANGARMTLKLGSSSGKEEQCFVVALFDANRKLMESISEKVNSALAFAVKPEATYYIKLDLRNSPIKEPAYRLQIHFN